MYLSGSGATDPRWLDKILKHPPTSLSTLEYWVGKLDVDFAGGEGRGTVFRPGFGAQEGRGELRADIARLVAKFRFYPYHEHHERPRDMTLTGFDVVLHAPFANVQQLVESRLGKGRTFAGEHGAVTEYGKWWYLHDSGGLAHLSYEALRPTWAAPRVPVGALETFLFTLHDRLICDADLQHTRAALAPLAPSTNAEVHDWNLPHQLDISFRPGVPLKTVLAALRWKDCVASSGDVHMSSWRVSPQNGSNKIGRWEVGVRLEGWPRGANREDLPRVGRAGPSPLIDVDACATPVAGITIE